MSKVYIFCDLEGIAGIDGAQYLERGSREYVEAQQWVTQDVNAVIAGVYEGGASGVTVFDVHDGGGNILADKMDGRARLEPPNECSLDGSYASLLLIGHHAKAGTLNAFLDHTRNGPTWFALRINGQEVGEIYLAAAYAGYFGVPLALVTGDEAACEEAESVSSGLTTVPVKSAVGRGVAQCLPPDVARAQMRQAASQAVRTATELDPLHISVPAVIEVVYCRTDYADAAIASSRFERVDARTVRTKISNARELYAAMPPG